MIRFRRIYASASRGGEVRLYERGQKLGPLGERFNTWWHTHTAQHRLAAVEQYKHNGSRVTAHRCRGAVHGQRNFASVLRRGTRPAERHIDGAVLLRVRCPLS